MRPTSPSSPARRADAPSEPAITAGGRWALRNWPLAVKLVALVVVPLAAFLVLAIARIVDRLGKAGLADPSDAAGHRTAAVITGAVILLVLAATALLLTVVHRSLARPLRLLRRSALDVAERRLPGAVRSSREGEAPDITVVPTPIGTREEVGDVARAFDQVHDQALRLAAEQAGMRTAFTSVFVNLSRRNQALVDRQLRLIESLENTEESPEALADLFALDHLATRMRRNSENLLVVAGSDLSRRASKPVPLVDVLRAATSEVEHYERVDLGSPVAAPLLGRLAGDVVHLLAELLENATTFSAPETRVEVRTERRDGGDLLIEITDAGVGMTEDDLQEANARLDRTPLADVSASRRMGLFVVGRLAVRHDIAVTLSAGEDGGVIARTVVPAAAVVEPQADTPTALPAAGRPAADPASVPEPRTGPVGTTDLPRRTPGETGGFSPRTSTPAQGRSGRPESPAPTAGDGIFTPTVEPGAGDGNGNGHAGNGHDTDRRAGTPGRGAAAGLFGAGLLGTGALRAQRPGPDGTADDGSDDRTDRADDAGSDGHLDQDDRPGDEAWFASPPAGSGSQTPTGDGRAPAPEESPDGLPTAHGAGAYALFDRDGRGPEDADLDGDLDADDLDADDLDADDPDGDLDDRHATRPGDDDAVTVWRRPESAPAEPPTIRRARPGTTASAGQEADDALDTPPLGFPLPTVPGDDAAAESFEGPEPSRTPTPPEGTPAAPPAVPTSALPGPPPTALRSLVRRTPPEPPAPEPPAPEPTAPEQAAPEPVAPDPLAPDPLAPEPTGASAPTTAASSPGAPFDGDPLTGHPLTGDPLTGDPFADAGLPDPGPSVPRAATPIFDEVASLWFRDTGGDGSEPVPSEDWQTSGDEGWEAAASSLEAPDAGVTPAGLPRRRPRAHLVPGSARTTTSPAPTTEAPAPRRSAEDVRGRLERFQRGVADGRSAQHARTTTTVDEGTPSHGDEEQR